MTDENIYGLMDVFKRNNNQYLTLTEITRRMQELGLYPNAEFAVARVDIYLYYLKPPIFHEIQNYRRRENWGKRWNVAHWLPRKEIQHAVSPSGSEIKNGVTSLHEQDKENNPYDNTISLLQIGKEIQRTISPSGIEVENGTIPLRGDFDSFYASMDMYQQRQKSIDVGYYADENATCKVEQDKHDHWILKSEWLKDWYKGNRIEPGDVIWLTVEGVAPLIINLSTKWDRDPDAYRRYKLLQEATPLPSVNLPIWYIVCEFFEQTSKISRKSDIEKFVLEKRSRVSKGSVGGCLSANQLFVRVGDGYWGLKEWNLEEVTRTMRPAGSSLEESLDLPTEIVPLDYILANIASENLVYRILEESPSPLTVVEITKRISKILGVNKDVLARATFFDPSDPRFYRQEDGAFTLRKNLEEVIHHLSENERVLKISLENEIQKLQETMESLTSQHKKEANQLKEEQDILKKLAGEWIEQIEHYEKINNQREKRIQLMSEFLAEAIPHIGQDKLKEIFEHLHHKSELRNMIDSDEIIKFSKIARKFLPRLQD